MSITAQGVELQDSRTERLINHSGSRSDQQPDQLQSLYIKTTIQLVVNGGSLSRTRRARRTSEQWCERASRGGRASEVAKHRVRSPASSCANGVNLDAGIEQRLRAAASERVAEEAGSITDRYSRHSERALELLQKPATTQRSASRVQQQRRRVIHERSCEQTPPYALIRMPSFERTQGSVDAARIVDVSTMDRLRLRHRQMQDR